MIWKGVEGGIARNGITLHTKPWFIFVKLTRRFIIRCGRHELVLFLDLRRDHPMYRPADVDAHYLRCRRCDISTYFWVVGPADLIDPPKKDTSAFCSGKLYRWSKK